MSVAEFADELEIQRTHATAYEAGRIPVGGRVALHIEDTFGAHFAEARVTLSEIMRGKFKQGRRGR